MIPEIVSYITRSEGKKFRRLSPAYDDDAVHSDGQGTALYVHIPFCRALCPFCCFNRYLFKEDLARRYFIDLRKELELYVKRGFVFTGVYFGGGTPTIMMDELTGFIRHLRDQFPIKQLSLETTPRDITAENIEMLQQVGVNRLSIGIQSFEDEVLKTMGRNNGPADEVKQRLLMAEGQFQTVNVDFVFNFPGQTVAQFESDVAAFKELGIDQATFYPLMASPHKKDAMERKFNRVDNSREKRFYDVILRELYHGDYTPSTAWCFSRGDHMIDEYIIDYDDYVGIGSGSVSILKGNFYANTFSLDKYHQMTVADRLPIIGWRSLSRRENLRYYLLTKLFGMQMDMDAYNRRFDVKGVGPLWLELAFFKTCGLVSGDKKLQVTEKGMHPVSVMMREFFASLNTLREECIEHQI
jgi:coproporphyrinogen III oxidase-like Fe-S oxidoreductase